MIKIFAIILIGAATIGFASGLAAATGDARGNYQSVKLSADADYKIARKTCNSLTGNPKAVCVQEAKATRTRTKSTAQAQYENTLRAQTNARTAIANADYALAKARCGSQNGNLKDVCIKEAKADNITTIANAKADKKIVTALADAREDKLEANFKLAIEKCDALAGAANDSCVATAKAQYGK